MSDLLRELRVRVESRIEPHVTLYGDDAPVVRMARLILQDAEEIEAKMSERRVTTAEAVEETGWVSETLQRYARVSLEDGSLPDAWKGLKVEQTPSGYLFVLATIPPNPRRASAA